jgi:phosphoribosylformylglycinamidine (FGAM) synthase-like enzyme
MDLRIEASLLRVLAELAGKGLIHSACDVCGGGLAVALIKACFANGIGVQAGQQRGTGEPGALTYFGESASQVLVSCPREAYEQISRIVEPGGNGLVVEILGLTTDGAIDIMLDGETVISGSVDSLREVWSTSLESHLTEEVIA